MNRLAERSDCSRLRFSEIEDVTKNVRQGAAIFDGSAPRIGIDTYHGGMPAGEASVMNVTNCQEYRPTKGLSAAAKAALLVSVPTARLKTCPDTNLHKRG